VTTLLFIQVTSVFLSVGLGAGLLKTQLVLLPVRPNLVESPQAGRPDNHDNVEFVILLSEKLQPNHVNNKQNLLKIADFYA
jgi:hypothetical protein